MKLDPVVARAYRHPVLGERVVVRMCAENLCEGLELEMELLGFGEGADRGVVDEEPRRALGFPGWALVHDPKNARHALAVVKELKAAARLAKTKPGHAKDAVQAIAEELGTSVPQFLPSFYEEAGRAFIEHGAIAYAAVMFGKAREAEGVHALEVDEQHRLDAFLEFALAGAVTTKALAQYAKDLAEHHEAKVAYAHFRQLCVQRTLGGMPPWAGMAKELRRLAKAAGLDVAQEDRALVADIIESPALGKAGAELWRSYAEALAALGKGSAKVRGVLLNLMPTGGAYSAELDEAWLEVLEASGAIAGLIGEAQPEGARAAWFDKLTTHLSRDWRDREIGGRADALLARMAPALIADGVGIACGDRWRMDLNLVEKALALGVPVAPRHDGRIDLKAWAKREDRVDPVRAAEHAVIGPKLAGAVAAEMGSEPFDEAARGKRGLAAAKRAWLEGLIARAEQGSLVALGEAIATVTAKVKAETFAELPDLHARFAALDAAAALARTLRVGLIDEWGWPALEDAAAELDPDGNGVYVFGGAPALIVATKTRAIAVGAAGRLGAHDFVLPARHEVVNVRFIGGQFLVVLGGEGKVRGYWSTAPRDVFETDANRWAMSPIAARAAVLADGAWVERGSPIRAGDRAVPSGTPIAACDGATTWQLEHHQKWREVGAHGELGRVSWPDFIERGVEEGWKIDPVASYVLPGAGARIRTRGERREIVMMDGARWEGDVPGATGVVRWPGGSRLIIESPGGYNQPALVTIADAETGVRGVVLGADRKMYRGQVAVLPPTLWGLLRVRDEAGSQRLRAVTDADARALYTSGALAGVTHPRLKRGIDGVLALAIELHDKRVALAAERAPGKAAAVASAGPTDEALQEALGGWIDPAWANAGSAWAQIGRVVEWFAGERGDRFAADLPPSVIDWLDFAVARQAVAFLTHATGTSPESREALAQVAAALVQLPPAAKLRTYVSSTAPQDMTTGRTMRLVWSGGHAYALRSVSWQAAPLRVLEYAPDGVFAALHGTSVGDELRAITADGTPEPWSETAVARLASATGLTESEAAYLYAGMPRGNVRSANFLPKELRERLGLKANQAKAARDALVAVPRAHRVAAIAAGVAGVEAMALAWTQRRGKRIEVPDELVADAARELAAQMKPAEALAMIGAGGERLVEDGAWAFAANGDLQRVPRAEPLVGQEPLRGGPPVFDKAVIEALAMYVPYLYAELPVGHALRTQAAVAHALAQQRLANRALWIEHGTHYVADPAQAGALLGAIGGAEITGLAEGVRGVRVPGAVVMHDRARLRLAFATGECDAAATALVDKLVQQVPVWGLSSWRMFQYLRSPGLAAIAARIRETPVAAGGWEQDPRASAPGVVAAVMKKLKLGEDAAALYLQYLATLWPTPKQVQIWNGWSTKQLAGANAELVAAELVLEAKRERAQRKHFLPGGWEALKSPHPPMETWKLALYGVRNATGDGEAPLGRFLALAPFHALFAAAWERIAEGDVPRYEDVKP